MQWDHLTRTECWATVRSIAIRWMEPVEQMPLRKISRKTVNYRLLGRSVDRPKEERNKLLNNKGMISLIIKKNDFPEHLKYTSKLVCLLTGANLGLHFGWGGDFFNHISFS